jgi:hypothetical protein
MSWGAGCLTTLDILATKTYHGGMKTFIRILLAGVVFAASQGISLADSTYSFSFSVAQKKEAETKQENYYETTKNQKWSYVVTMENKSFKDVSDIEIKYVMFSKSVATTRVTQNGREEFQRHEGSTTIKTLKNNDQVTFSTDGVMLKSVQLADGWTYVGGSTGAKGALRGLWLRVYVGGQMVSEFMDPPDLNNKATFDPPAKN